MDFVPYRKSYPPHIFVTDLDMCLLDSACPLEHTSCIESKQSIYQRDAIFSS
jgi:hypothetical protein